MPTLVDPLVLCCNDPQFPHITPMVCLGTKILLQADKVKSYLFLSRLVSSAPIKIERARGS